MSSHDVARLVFGYLSEQGLEETKNTFIKESQELLKSNLENELNDGQRLSLILQEYFLLKKIEKKGKSTDPETVLLMLWKQFDVLVGQLKHTTIHKSENGKVKVKRGGFRDQKARVRELNKQNREALQQKNKTLAAGNRDVFPKPVNIPPICVVSAGNVIYHQIPPQDSINNQYSQIRSYSSQSSNISPVYNVITTVGNKTPTKSCNEGLVHDNVISESVQEVYSSEQFPSEQFKSPKRKSLPPKKRTGETAVVMPPTQVASNAITSTPDDNAVDIQAIVDKILGRPELPEKLAENINRAVEIETTTTASSVHQPDVVNTETQSCVQTQSAVVNRNKVEDIMDMMKCDPVFEELFSSFENFESSCEESESGQTKVDNKPESLAQKSKSTSSRNEEYSNEALDALLLLANSPMKRPSEASCSLETPQKNNATVMLSSPIIPPSSSVPVVLSPGDSTPTKRNLQPIMSHVRQLNFTDTSKKIENSMNSQGEYSGSNAAELSKERASNIIVMPECSELNEHGEKSAGSKQELVEVTSDNSSNTSKDIEKVSSNEKKSEIGEVTRNDPVLFQTGQNNFEYSSEENSCEKINVVGYKEKAGNNTMSDTERISGIHESPLKLSALEDLATNELLQSKKVHFVGTERTRDESSLNTVDDGGCNRTIDVMLCEPSQAKNISMGPTETSTKVSDGVTSLTEEFTPHQGEFTNIKTPENKCSKNDLSSSTESDKTSKRKLSKKKKSSRSSKKTKLIPEDLDVDKFLSRLHYVQGEKT